MCIDTLKGFVIGYLWGKQRQVIRLERYVNVMKSEKVTEIINNQVPMNKTVIKRVKQSLLKKGVIIEQSEELDKWLVSKGAEAITFSSGTIIIMHTKVSASGFFEELIHYGQICKGLTIDGDKENNILMEIAAKERLIKNRRAYKITDYEIDLLTDSISWYKIQLDEIRKGG